MCAYVQRDFEQYTGCSHIFDYGRVGSLIVCLQRLWLLLREGTVLFLVKD